MVLCPRRVSPYARRLKLPATQKLGLTELRPIQAHYPHRQVRPLIADILLSAVITNSVPRARGAVPVTGAAVEQIKHPIPTWYMRAAERYHVGWHVLAAVDVYGATTRAPDGVVRPKRGPASIVGYRFPAVEWQGVGNPAEYDHHPARIAIFCGRGIDGDNDGKADQDNPYDRTAAVARWLTAEGTTEQDITNVLWKHYSEETPVERIIALSHVFQKFSTTQLDARSFPVHKRFSYSFRDSWGDARSFGGRRMHEGTDIFAGYGTPVLSVCYGYVELIGWNRLGGWRVGVRAADNTYFYYAHLSSYAKGLKQGVILRPGQVIGYVGSSGYGRPGTAGKFPPHLHFGVYRDTGKAEWAMDPYGLLKRWERMPQVVIYPEKNKAGIAYRTARRH